MNTYGAPFSPGPGDGEIGGREVGGGLLRETHRYRRCAGLGTKRRIDFPLNFQKGGKEGRRPSMALGGS